MDVVCPSFPRLSPTSHQPTVGQLALISYKGRNPSNQTLYLFLHVPPRWTPTCPKVMRKNKAAKNLSELIKLHSHGRHPLLALKDRVSVFRKNGVYVSMPNLLMTSTWQVENSIYFGVIEEIKKSAWLDLSDFSPNSLPWGSLLEKRLAAICPGCVPRACPPRVRLGSALAAPPSLVHHVSVLCLPCAALSPRRPRPPWARHASAFCPALCPLWPRLHILSAMRRPCLLSATCPPCVRPCVHFGCLQTLSAMCLPCLLSTIYLLKPCLWTLSALGLLWGRAMASSGQILSHHCATHTVYIARALVGFLHIFILAHQIRPLQGHPMLELHQRDPKQFFKHNVRLQGPNLEAKMNSKEIDQQACNPNAAGCTMLRKIFILHDARALPNSRPRADKVQRRNHMVDLSWQKRAHGGHTQQTQAAHIERTRFGGVAKVDTWWTQGGPMADIYMWRIRFDGAAKADSTQTQDGHVADTRRAHGGHNTTADLRDTWLTHRRSKADTHGRHTRTRFGDAATEADTRRTQGRQSVATRPERNQSGHKADKGGQWRIHGGQGLEARPKRSQGGHMADTWRTSSGDAVRAYRGQLFFPKREPHSKLFGVYAGIIFWFSYHVLSPTCRAPHLVFRATLHSKAKRRLDMCRQLIRREKTLHFVVNS